MSGRSGDDESDYTRFRGKCRSMCEAAIATDSTLRLVRGHYYCPIWNTREQHWWTIRSDGSIYDPTKDQFPSRGEGEYEEFDGLCDCSQCGRKVPEDEAYIHVSYAFCSYTCYGRFIGF